MARIFKPTYPKPLPAGAKLFTRAGKRYARFKNAKGRTVEAALSKDGNKILIESARYRIEYRVAGVVKTAKGFKDRKATEQRAAELERKAERRAANLADPFEDHGRRSLVAHLDDFEAALKAKGGTEDHATLTAGRARRVIEECEFLTIADLSASRVETYLAGLRPVRKRKAAKGLGLSVQTRNFYLSAVKQFCRWMVRDRRMADNPLVHLCGGNVKLDRRHDRRALSVAEFEVLIRTACEGPDRFHFTGKARAMLYLTAAYVGLRAKELASLTPGSLDFDAPAVTVEAAYAKNRREDTLPLHPLLADMLKEWVRGKAKDAPLWPGNWAKNKEGGKLLKFDLERAGIAYRDADGLYADFHALRHTYLTNLARAGVAPKVIQTLARHSTITLTLDRYAHVEIHDQTAALDFLPPPPTGKGEGEKNAAAE